MFRFIKKIFGAILAFVVQFIGSIQWQPDREISEHQKAEIRNLLGPHYFIILTWRSNHLSSYFISLANFILRGKFGRYSHTLMNVEDEVTSDVDFRLVEAIGTGVKYSPFHHVFNVQRVCLLKPKSMSLDAWTAVMDRAKAQLGKPYDSFFNIKDDLNLSCVELVRLALMAEPNYHENFAHFEKMITKAKNLTPQMFRDCEDFEVVYEIRT